MLLSRNILKILVDLQVEVKVVTDSHKETSSYNIVKKLRQEK